MSPLVATHEPLVKGVHGMSYIKRSGDDGIGEQQYAEIICVLPQFCTGRVGPVGCHSGLDGKLGENARRQPYGGGGAEEALKTIALRRYATRTIGQRRPRVPFSIYPKPPKNDHSRPWPWLDQNQRNALVSEGISLMTQDCTGILK